MIKTARKAAFERPPHSAEMESARRLREAIASRIKDHNEPTRLSVASNGSDLRIVTLSPALTDLLLEVLRMVSSGQGVCVTAVEAELTTQQAADLLNVSRPYLVKLLENGEMPFTRTGRHRRIRAADLFEFKVKRDAERFDALAALAKMDARDLA